MRSRFLIREGWNLGVFLEGNALVVCLIGASLLVYSHDESNGGIIAETGEDGVYNLQYG